jgi:dipeptidyl aminopeptidase/acylaminoacyl peptidase
MLVLALILDVGWREGVGIVFGIEEAFAPSRVVLLIGLGMVAVTPLRAALLLGADRVPRPTVLLSAALTIAALGWPGGFHPAQTAWLAVDPDLPEPRIDLWAMDADGSHQTRLIEATEGSNLGYASWAPDGTRIAYTTFRVPPAGIASAEASVWAANADGDEPVALLDADEFRWIPRFTPDGMHVLYTQEAQGGPWMEEGPVGPGAAAGPQGPLSVPLPQADIWRVPASGGEPERLTDSAGDDRAPVPSPDGSLILFDATRDGNTELYVMDADGANPRRLTDDPGEDWGASWSPDGTRIAFNSSRTGDMEIFVMSADGEDVRQLTFDRGTNTSPTWSPDGSRIAFTVRADDGFGQIWSMASDDGSDRRDLSRSPSTDDQVWTGGWGTHGRIVFARGQAPPAEATPLVRFDLGTAAMLLSVALVAAVVVVLARTAPPLGSFTLVLTIATALLSAPGGEWRFVVAGVAAGLATDIGAWLGPTHLRGRIAAATSAAAFVLAAAGIAQATTGLEWTPTLALGVAFAAGAIGWGIGLLAEGPPRRADVGPP